MGAVEILTSLLLNGRINTLASVIDTDHLGGILYRIVITMFYKRMSNQIVE